MVRHIPAGDSGWLLSGTSVSLHIIGLQPPAYRSDGDVSRRCSERESNSVLNVMLEIACIDKRECDVCVSAITS